MFFKIPSYLEQRLFYNNYFLVTNTFSDQLRLEDKYFYSTASVWMSFSFRINNYSEYTFSKLVPLPDNYFFRGRTFLGAGISWKQSFFLLVLCNQFHSIYIWNRYVASVTFKEVTGNCGIPKQASKDGPNEFCSTGGTKVVAIRIC